MEMDGHQKKLLTLLKICKRKDESIIMQIENERTFITRMRSIALLFIVLSHCTEMPANSAKFALILKQIFIPFYSFGVWIFFLLAGYLFAYEKEDFKTVIQKKIKKIIVPWFFSGIVLYLYFRIRHGQLTVNIFQYCLGVGNHLWYMSTYFFWMLIFLICRKRMKNILLPLVFFGVGLILEIPEVFQELASNYYMQWYIVGAWPLAIISGYVINKKNKQLFCKVIKQLGWFSIVPFGIVMYYGYCNPSVLQYWDYAYLPLCILITPAILETVFILEKIIPNVMREIGEKSFAIYLFHMPIAGLVNNICCRFDHGYTVLLRPVIVIALTWMLINVSLLFARLINKENFMKMLMGVR